MRSYAIGDIHGQLALLQAAHGLIAADRAATGDDTAPVVHVGDLVDRGPDSRGVVEFLRAGIAAGAPWVVLLGNHDRMLLRWLDDPSAGDPGLSPAYSWLHPRIGGGATLASYGVRAPADRPVAAVHAEALTAVPESHRAFLAALPRWYRRGAALFVHAGIRPGFAPEAQDETDLLWIRGAFLDDPRDHGALVVHGHTAVDAPDLRANRLNIDTGAAYGGPLTAVVLEGREAHLLTPHGRRRL